MKHITFYLDFISPLAYQGFNAMPQALMGLSYSVTYKPVLLGPAQHPFNPLHLLRLAVATDPNGHPNRYVCETLFRHVWQAGADAADATRLQALVQKLSPRRDPADTSVTAQLKAHGDAAIAQGVLSVPAYAVDGKVFCGLDALPMLRAYMVGPAP